MWLLDNNLPRHIIPILEANSIKFETARSRGWARLRNGELVAAASEAGFTCILTRDGLFQSDASKALREHPNMSIVLVTIPQVPGKRYADLFNTAWNSNPIVPLRGQLLHWP